MRIEAANLQDAFQQAAQKLNCSVTELDIKVIQHPSSGFLGFFKKNAIIEAVNEKSQTKQNIKKSNEQNIQKPEKVENSEANNDKKNDKKKRKQKNDKNKEDNRNENFENKSKKKQNLENSVSNVLSDVFEENREKAQERKRDYIIKRLDDIKEKKIEKHDTKNILDKSIIDNFHQEHNKEEGKIINFDEILPSIQDGLQKLFIGSCFNISKVEVSKYSDDTVLIEIEGDDAALLIGKEGYRYKAISYMLHNWINPKYNVSIRLEIAEFLKNQEAMMDQYLLSVIERVQTNGRAQTKPLDGVLVKIALAKLRDKFPKKYVGIKSNGNDKFVVVNDFLKK